MPLLGRNYRDLPKFERRKWQEVRKGYTHFADRDVLLAKITPCFENGKAGIPQSLPNGIGAGSTEFFVCRVLDKILIPEYLLALFKTHQFLREGEVTMTGSVGHKRVPKEYLLNSEIPLAPLNEQKRIIDKLDALLARVDACRERLDRVPLILKRFRQAVLAAATSGQLTEDWREANKVKTSSTKPLSKIVTLKTGPFGSTLHKEDYVLNGVPVINPMHINAGSITPTSNVSVSVSKADELNEFRLKTGDVVLARRGVMGRCAVVTKVENNWLCGTGSMILRPSKEVMSAYLQFCLSSQDVVSALEQQSVGSTMVNLNQGILFGLEILLPSIPEQHEIVRRVETLFAFADRLDSRYNTARTQVDNLTPSLLDKAFRGELVSQDSNDEPAEKLLERIRTTQAGSAPRRRTSAPRTTSPVKRPLYLEPFAPLPLVAEPSAVYTGNIPQAILAAMQPGKEHSRADILAATGIKESDWLWAIRQLKEGGKVVQVGEKRGARYALKW